MVGWQIFKLSNRQKISRFSNSGLKIGNITNFHHAPFISGKHFVLLSFFMIDMVT